MVDLSDCRILVVEDELVIALDLASTLQRLGATVLGPASSVASALALLGATHRVDGAILDIGLGPELVFPVADVLAARGVPYVFSTGCDEAIVPAAHRGAPRLQKPLDPEAVAAALFPRAGGPAPRPSPRGRAGWGVAR